MSHQNKIDEEHKTKLEDNFLSHIGFEYVDKLCDALDAEKEQWKNTTVPDSLDQWFRGYQKLEKKRRSRRQKLQRFSRRAAIFILFVLAVNCLLYTSVKAYRMNFYNTILSIKDKFTQIDMVKGAPDYTSDLPQDWTEKYYPAYIPEGYQLSFINDNPNTSTLMFQNDIDNQIVFDQFYNQSSQQIDTENGVITQILINGEPAYLLERKNYRLITWKEDEVIFRLQVSDLDINEMIKIAESVELKK